MALVVCCAVVEILGLAVPMSACSARTVPWTETTYSSNGRFGLRLEVRSGGSTLRMFERRSFGIRSLWQRRVAEIPTELLVSNDGRWLVFIHEYPNRHGQTVEVQDRDGKVLHAFSDEDFFPASEIAELRTGCGRAWWYDAWLSSSPDRLDLQLAPCSWHVCAWPPQQVSIAIAEGRPPFPVAQRLPRRTEHVALVPPSPRNPGRFEARGPRCADTESVDEAIPFLNLAPAAPALPSYTEAGRRASVAGVVVLELQIGAEGQVNCATVMQRLPLGLDTNAVDAALEWQFEPADTSRRRTIVGVEFGFGYEVPPGARLADLRREGLREHAGRDGQRDPPLESPR
jgi:TonB family protein